MTDTITYQYINLPYKVILYISPESQQLKYTNAQILKLKFYCFTVHFNSLNIIQQLMHFYIQ